MFSLGILNESIHVKKRIISILICLTLGFSLGGNIWKQTPSWAEMPEIHPEDLIRFHVVANSDSEDDQRLKYAVRDAILKEVAPILAGSVSLNESRQILKNMEGKITLIAQSAIKEWGKDYPVKLAYGIYTFPTKSYGNIVLPAGEYEAVKINIGEAEGANWWCVLFPPLCFVNVEEATSLPVDGKPGVPITEELKKENSNSEETGLKSKDKGLKYKDKDVGFFFSRFLD